ncbi:hypothetical protein [Methyloversatilis thermotolerans]|uniref:hypothetical protein n=1 Tax=Methyloversatilis thermotolerans TaxID=1346290 RepID=UPI00039A648C|nr:hypothetical protein [Methyloversatilis thermotolerans]
MAEGDASLKGALASAIAVARDLVAVLRDGALFLLAALLILFPATFNSILVNAGFEEGSLVGFKWKSKLIESNSALEEAQATIAQLQARNDELLKALSDAGGAGRSPELERRLSVFERENAQLKVSTESTQNKVADAIQANTPLVERALSTLSPAQRSEPGRSAYTVGLQTLGVDDAERIALNDGLRGEGFALDSLTYSYAAGERPGWFSDRSTVFYYASSSRAMAEQVAAYLKARTGQDFTVRRGAGLGVDPARKAYTLFVHYIKA